MKQQDQDTVINEYKMKLFDYTKELVSNELNIKLYLLFLIIENLQFIGYHYNGNIEYGALGIQQLGSIARYLNWMTAMKKQNIAIFFVPLFTVLSIIHMILIIMGYRAYNNKKNNNSIEHKNFHKNRIDYFINLSMICFNTFLTIPVFQTSITSILCLPTSPYSAHLDCYQGNQIFITVLAIINVLWLFFTNFYYSLYYYSRNPFYTNALTCSSNWWNIGKFSIKIAPMIYFTYDSNMQFVLLYLIVMTASYGGYVALFRILFPYYRYNFTLEKIIFIIEIFTFLINSSFCLIYILKNVFPSQKPPFIFIAWIIMSAFLTKLLLEIMINRKKNLIIDLHSIQKKKIPNTLEYIIYIIYETQKTFQEGKGKFYISAIYKLHKEKCMNQSCYCIKLKQEFKNPNYFKNKKLFYMMVLSIIDNVILQNKKAYPFFILKAYILYYKMESEIKAATTIAIIMSNKLDFSDQMLVKGLLFELDRQYTDTRDMEMYRKFNECLLKQEEQSISIAYFYMQYWSELIDQHSSLPKLHVLLKKIKRQKKKLNIVIEQALKIFNNHVRVLFLYKNLQKEVINDYLAFVKCQERYRIGMRQNKLTNVDAVNMIQFRPNEDLLVLNFTKNNSSQSQVLGNYVILNISSNVKEILGFSNLQLRNQSINKLIPTLYHTIHDKYIDNILEKEDKSIFSKQIRIFPINNNGNVIECNIISKFMPSITHGINISSFLQKCDINKDEFFLVYDGNSGIVDSMNQEAELMLKDQSRRKMNNILSIPDHITDLIPNWDYRNEQWKDVDNSARSLSNLIFNTKDIQYDIKQINLIRSDRVDALNIKVIKFKGDYFIKMFTIQNESLKDNNSNNSIQGYFDSQKPNSIMKLDSAEIQKIIKIQTMRVLERKSSSNSQKKNQINVNSHINIQQQLPKSSTSLFIAAQICIAIVVLALALFQLIRFNETFDSYKEDSLLIIQINQLQNILSDSTYVLELYISTISYSESNMTVPYSRGHYLLVDIQQQLQEFEQFIIHLKQITDDLTPKLLKKINNGQMKKDILNIDVRYLLKEGTKVYYNKSFDIIQAIYQYIQYGTDITYRIQHQHEDIENIIKSPNYYYVFANNVKNIPQKLISIKNQILNVIRNRLNNHIASLTYSMIANFVLIIGSIIIVKWYYFYIFSKYIYNVIEFYQKIKIPQVKIFYKKCQRYKKSLDFKEQGEFSNSQEANHMQRSQLNIIPGTEPQEDQIIQYKSFQQIAIDQEKVELAQKDHLVQQKMMMGHAEIHLNFEEKPKVKKQTYLLSIWIVIFILFAALMTYLYTFWLSSLQKEILILNDYTIMDNSIIQMRLCTQLSMNVISYWQASDLKVIQSELDIYLTNAMNMINKKELDFSQILTDIAIKYELVKYIKFLVQNNDKTTTNDKLTNIQLQLQEIDHILKVLSTYDNRQLQINQKNAEKLKNIFLIVMILNWLTIIIYFTFVITYYFKKLKRINEFTYEMFNVITISLNSKK